MVPTQEIGNLQSLITMVGGKVVYAAPPFESVNGGSRVSQLNAPPRSSGEP
jgi:hypothetical protein